MFKKIVSVLLAAALLFGLAACGEQKPEEPEPYKPSYERVAEILNDEKVKADVDKVAETLGFRGSVLVARGEEILYAGGYGKNHHDDSPDNDATTVYAVGSCSKEFTAASILLLASQGKLSLDDNLHKYFPEFPEENGVTLYHLLHMQSGLHRDFYSLSKIVYGYKDSKAEGIEVRPQEKETLIDMICKDPLQYEPGSQYEYSNVNYTALAFIVEQVSGMEFGDFVKQNIYDPLGMTDAGMNFPENVVPGHSNGTTQRENPTVYVGAGTVSGSVYDMYEFLKGLHGGRLLDEEWYGVMTHPDKGDYCCGLVQGKGFIWHNGLLNGYSAFMAYYPDADLYIVIESNDRMYSFLGQLEAQPADKFFELLVSKLGSAYTKPAPKETESEDKDQ